MPIIILFCCIGLILFIYGVLEIPVGMKKKTFVVLMIFALVSPFLHFATTPIWAKLFSLTFEHLQPLKFFVWGIIAGGLLFYAFLGIFVFKTFRKQYLFLTFSLFWVLLGIVLNTVFGLASFYLPD